MNLAPNLACPIDGEPLVQRDRQLQCGRGHGFDIARQGYVNLLPVQHKRSRQPGDSKEMVQARSRFLNSGVYRPIATRLAELAGSLCAGVEQPCLLDAGCGEGYYLGSLRSALAASNACATLTGIGLDISKYAILEAAKRSRDITWVVGTNRQPPIAPDSVDLVTCLFGFHSYDGFHRVLRPGGKLVLVEPGPDHLQELRTVIYPDVKKTGSPSSGAVEARGFQPVDSRPLRFNVAVINKALIGDLLLMTPHFHRASRQGREAALALQSLELTVDVVFQVMEKSASE